MLYSVGEDEGIDEDILERLNDLSKLLPGDIFHIEERWTLNNFPCVPGHYVISPIGLRRFEVGA